MFVNNFISILAVCIALELISGCAKKPVPDGESTLSASTGRYLYVASGRCYSGNNTTFTNTTSSNLIYRLNLDNGLLDSVLSDYYASPANTGDSPASIVDGDANYFYALVENTTTATLRRIEKIEKKSYGSRTTFSNNITALSAPLRSLLRLGNGDFAISKSSAIEYLTSSNARLGAPYINATAAPCNTSTTLISKVLNLSNGKFVFLHSAASQNRFGIFAATGGTTCAAAQSAPNANAYPSATFYDQANQKLFVAYAGNASTTDLNSIYVYSIDESTNAISSPQKIYDASLYPATYSYLLYGVSEMAFDSEENVVYISTAISNATTAVNYSIEKFTYDPTQIGVDNTKVLTRIGNTPFYDFGNDTKCISGMFVGN